MGQKTNPIANRLGIIRGWESSWYGGKDFGRKVVEDEKIRVYLRARIPKGGIARIIIERTLKAYHVDYSHISSRDRDWKRWKRSGYFA